MPTDTESRSRIAERNLFGFHHETTIQCSVRISHALRGRGKPQPRVWNTQIRMCMSARETQLLNPRVRIPMAQVDQDMCPTLLCKDALLSVQCQRVTDLFEGELRKLIAQSCTRCEDYGVLWYVQPAQPPLSIFPIAFHVDPST
jgi:hypothetical protein